MLEYPKFVNFRKYENAMNMHQDPNMKSSEYSKIPSIPYHYICKRCTRF